MGGHRVGGDVALTCAYDDASENSLTRRETINSFSGSLMREPFGWLAEPVQLNRYTRLAAEMCPARGIIRVMGLGRSAGERPRCAGDANARSGCDRDDRRLCSFRL